MPIDVTMPDGTVIRNVPDGTTKAELMRRYESLTGQEAPPALPSRMRGFREDEFPRLPVDESLGRLAIGINDAAHSAFRNLAAAIAGGAAAVPALPDTEAAAGIFESVSQGPLSREPQTAEGELMLEALGVPYSMVTPVGQFLGDKTFEATGSPEAATAVQTGIEAAPMLLSKRTGRAGPRSFRQKNAQRAIDYNYVVDPASVAPQTGAGLAEGAGGVLKTRQIASYRNQLNTNRLAAKDIGLPGETVLTPQILSEVRRTAAESYEALRNSGRITADSIYRRDIANAVSRFKEGDFKLASQVGKEIRDQADDMAQLMEFSASDAVNQMRLLRDRSNTAGLQGEKSLAGGWRSLSNALENAVERDLVRRFGADSATVKNFRAARTRIAKTHTIEDALEGADVNAAKIMGAGKDVPLSGNLAMIADFAENFPKISKVVKDLPPTISPLDIGMQSTSLGGAGLAALTLDNPAAVGAAALPFMFNASRPLMREYALSGFGQRAAVRPPFKPAVPAMGLLGTTEAILSQNPLYYDQGN